MIEPNDKLSNEDAADAAPIASDFSLRAEAEWKATEYDCAQMRLDDMGIPTELHEGGDRLSIVGRINILWRRALKAESDLETINLRHGINEHRININKTMINLDLDEVTMEMEDVLARFGADMPDRYLKSSTTYIAIQALANGVDVYEVLDKVLRIADELNAQAIHFASRALPEGFNVPDVR
jgi:hypothetical protein